MNKFTNLINSGKIMMMLINPKIFENFETPNLGVLGQNDIWGFGLVARHRKYYKGEGGGFPKSRSW
jgi:hypothetical protein